MEFFFKDNFFSSGITTIMNNDGASVGTIDLKSAFGTSLDVYNESGAKVYDGRFPFFSAKWHVTASGEKLCGVLRVRMSFTTKRYEYDAGSRGVFEITSPAFSKEYEIKDLNGQLIASFTRTSTWLQSGAFCLRNGSRQFDSYELITVIMGVYAIQKINSASGG